MVLFQMFHTNFGHVNSSALQLEGPIMSGLYLQACKWQSLIFNCVRPFCHIPPNISTLPIGFHGTRFRKTFTLPTLYSYVVITKTERKPRFVCKQRIRCHIWTFNVVLHKPIQDSKTLWRCLKSGHLRIGLGWSPFWVFDKLYDPNVIVVTTRCSSGLIFCIQCTVAQV